MGGMLAIDTSAGTTVALVRNGVVLAESNHDSNMGHAETVALAIAEVLAAAPGVGVNSVVVGRGPAPFTGLRVGIAAAMMFSEGAKAQLSGVISLDAIALLELQENQNVSAANPLLVMILVPLLTLLVYPHLGKWASPLRRMSYGMFLAAFSYVIVAGLQQRMRSFAPAMDDAAARRVTAWCEGFADAGLDAQACTPDPALFG